jgi:UDP-GlcNAc:undecaprenyl-phosphate/decaprenyl-phosphate GlcNAc-1-phosphate transferase
MSILLICYFFIAIALSLAINYLLLKFSFNLGSRNNVAFKQVRWTAHVKPSIGGISFFIIFLLSWGIYGFISQEKGIVPDKQIIGIVAATSLGFLAGLYDDAFNTNPLLKFILQLTCGVILIAFNVKITISNLEFVNIFFTLMWVIGLMNSINMLDNMDGVTGSISAFIVAGIIGVLLMTGHSASDFYMLILIGVLGSLIGFLRFNWSPSKIFMGDTGSQFLGVFLASTSIIFLWRFNEGNQGLLQVKPFVLPALFFIIPIIDTTTVTVRRLLRGQSPFVGGKDHITHHFAYLGLKESNIVLLLLATTLLSFPVAALLVKNQFAWNFYVSFGVLGYVVALFFVFQFFYKKGELQHKKKRHDQRPIPKITKESLAAFNEKMQVNN